MRRVVALVLPSSSLEEALQAVSTASSARRAELGIDSR